MPLTIMVNSSDSVIPSMNGLMVSGASVWPMKMLAATLSDSAPLAPITFCMAIAISLHQPLHDAQVIKNGKERRDENDDGQHLKSEDEADLRCPRPASPKTNVLPACGIAEHRAHTRADGCLKHFAESGLQHEDGEGELQPEAPEPTCAV